MGCGQSGKHKRTTKEAKKTDAKAEGKAATDVKKPTILIAYYSTYGHIETMAGSVAEGVKSGGAKVKIMRIPETLGEEVLKKMHAKAKNPDHPVVTPEDIKGADGVIFGIPTRFGMASAQVKALIDATGSLWQNGSLVGKPAGIFTSTGSQNGGQETTIMTFITQLVHHGMLFIPIGYSHPDLQRMDEVKGGSPYGAGCLAGPDGSRQPSKLELGIAEHQGKYMAGVVAKLASA
ncbi:hypothetical protein AAMO2058_000608700 [Amorphochlora amoebiformis]